ncbi:VWA domain-containing protein [Candidatus Babeliales bacterium]|nr:VWA domain-containing protein [Candidatus Babeliales bacterium]
MVDFLGIYWAGAHRIIFSPFFAFAIFIIIRNYLKTRTNIELLVHKDNEKSIFKNFSLKRQFFKTACMIVCIIMIFLALLQPQWDKKEVKVAQEGRDLFIALDVSRSMLVKDLSPNRLEFTKLKIRNLLEKLEFERVGLILFSGSAFLQCPLTMDHNAFLMFLDQVDVETIASGTTCIGSAISKAIDIFSSCSERKNKLVLLATDGEDFSLNLHQVKSRAEKEDIKLFALGVGTKQGAPIPILDKKGNVVGHEKDENGQIAISSLNEKILNGICNDLSGKYFRASYNDSDLDQLVRIIEKYEKEKFEDRNISYYHDQYPWLLGVAFFMLLLEWIL